MVCYESCGMWLGLIGVVIFSFMLFFMCIVVVELNLVFVVFGCVVVVGVCVLVLLVWIKVLCLIW